MSEKIDAELVRALRAFLGEYEGRLLSPDGRCMVWSEGRPIVLDVLAARQTLELLSGRAA